MIDRLCWGAWSIARPRLVRCDAHWHRPKRADWRAKAYERSARWLCDPTLLIHNEQQYLPWFPDTHCVDGSNVAEGCRDVSKLYEARAHKSRCSARRWT